ncbi:MAG: hypothetical protein ACO1RX_03125 [Candidatus Sericytochromatia bacterium]
MTAIAPIQSVSGKLAHQLNPKPLLPLAPHANPVTPDDLEWAEKLDRKMEYGHVPSAEEQRRYNQIVENLKAVRDGGGYVYQDTTSFSNNPRGVAAIGSLVGRTLSGGFIGYRYGGNVSGILSNTLSQTKNSLANGEILGAVKNVAVGLKQTGVVSLKAGGISSAINAGTSVISNVAETLAGRQTGSEAVGNVTADTVGGFISGFGASIFSGVSTLGLTMAGAAGLPLTLVGVAGGAVGSVLLDKAYKASGLFSLIKNKVMGLLDEELPKVRPAVPVSGAPASPAPIPSAPSQPLAPPALLHPSLIAKPVRSAA